MSPFELQILLHYYGTKTDFRDGDLSASAAKSAIADFLEKDLLKLNTVASTEGRIGAKYRIAARGRVFVEALCATPLPIWSMPQPTQE